MIRYNAFEMKLLREFNNFKIPEKNKKVIVGFSGGADSVSLLVSLKRIESSYPLDIYALHLNHMLRGDEANRDMIFAKEICEKFSIKFFSKSIDVKKYAESNKLGIEEAAREVRYNFFREFSEENQIDYILTAHNMNDVAETILFHVIRGCGISGLSGIKRQRQNVIRPLLSFTREEIESYCEALGLDYVLDSSNLNTEYTRNYIRHIILPEMKKINPLIVQSLYRLSQSAIDANDALVLFENYSAAQKSGELCDELLFRRAKERFGLISDCQFSNNSFNELKKALSCNDEKTISFPDEIECVVKNGEFIFRKIEKEKEKKDISDTILLNGVNNITEDLVIEVSKDAILSPNSKYRFSKIYILNFDMVKGNLRVRSRKEGDSIKLGGMTRKIKKQFIEKRIPSENRDLVPIIYDEDGIVCVPEIGIADRVKSIGDNSIYIGIHSRKGFR